MFVVVQLPGGASIARTADVVRQAEAIVQARRRRSRIARRSSGLNFIDNYSQPNAAFLVVTLKPFEEREGRATRRDGMIARLGPKLRQISGGAVVPLAPPPIIGLGTGGGFSLCAAGSARRRPQGAWRRWCAGSPSPRTRIRSWRAYSRTFSATNPSIYLDIDRDKAQILGVQLNAIFQALQASLGGFYVNDINLFGRTWQVQVQAEAEDRSSVDDIYRINVRSAEGKMVPLRSLVEVRIVVGPQGLIRYNNTARP